MKLYVAGKFSSFRKIRKVVDQLKALGHEITWDWTRTDEFNEAGELKHGKDDGYINEQQITPETLLFYAESDLCGVAEADAVVLCCEPNMCGAYIEVGAALGAWPRKQVFVIDQQRWTIFYRLPEVVHFESLQKFFEYMERL
jgi:hypothetical protein